MSDFGYCLAYRKAWTHPIFKDLREAAIWNFLYQNAFWQDGVRNFNGQTFELKRGQIVVTTSFLARGFGMTEKGVRVVIQKLEKQGMLVKQGASKGTIITICNYDTFQEIGQTKGAQKGKQRANKGQTKGDNKNTYNTLNEDNTLIGDTPKTPKIKKPESVSDQTWIDFLAHRKTKKSNLTQTALNGIINQARIAQMPLEDVLVEMITRGWVGFKAEWINQTKGKPNGKTKSDIIAEQCQQIMDKYGDR